MKTLGLSIITISGIAIIGIIIFAVISSSQPKGIGVLENNAGVVTLGNQTFYIITLNDTLSSYHGVAVIPITFHNVNFTLFPNVFSIGPPGSCGNTNFGSEVKFSDGTYEQLGVHTPGSPCIENYIETALTSHTTPQAGVRDYHGKISLLVSTDVYKSST